MIRNSHAIVAVSLLLCSALDGRAAGIVSFNLLSGTQNSLASQDQAGAPGVRTTNWNQITSTALTFAPGSVKDNSGAYPPNLTVTLAPGGNFSDRGAGITNDNKMLNTVVDKFEGSPGVLSVSNVPYATYNVYVYQRPDYPLPGDGLSKTRGGCFTLTNNAGLVQRRYISTQDKTTAQPLPATVNNADGSGYILANTPNIASSGSFAQVEGGHYVKFSWLSNASFTVLMAALGAGAADDAGNVITDGDPVRRLKWSGFQIEEVPSGVATNLSLTASVPDMFPGDSGGFQLLVHADFDNGTGADVSSYPVTSFVSADNAVFTVSATGLVQPINPGTASLTVQFQTLSLTQAVTVLAPIALHPPTVTQSNLIVSGSGGQVTTAKLRANFNGYNNVDVSAFVGAGFTGGPAGVAGVTSQGTVTAVGPGTFFLVGSYGGLSATNSAAGTVTEFTPTELQLASPDGNLVLHVTVTNFAGSANCPVYRVTQNGTTLMANSRLGLTFGGVAWRENVAVLGWTTNSHDSVWQPVYGERSTVRDHYHELTWQLQETVAPNRELQLTFRAYDEGVAFCYTVPEQAGLANVAGLTEQTEFRFTSNHTAWSVTTAQGIYSKTTLSALPNGCERPLVLQFAPNRYVALAEAGLVDYARMKFNPLGSANSLVSVLHSAVNAALPLTTPWRVIMAAERPGQLLEHNDLIRNLNAPNQIADTSWIKPGKVIREVTLSTTGGVACVDFAVKHNLQYVEFDAGWYGPEGSDPDATSVDPARNLDLQHVINYGAANGVGVILYVNKLALANQIDLLPALYRSWGVKGIKFGFVNVGSQADTAWLHEAIRKCATNQIMVDVHDEYRVTGYERTYPNLMTVEGIGGDETTPGAEQTLNILFTRMIAGAADHTHCYFDNRVKNNWTHAYQLAKAVCFYSPWQFLYWYDRPTNSVGYVNRAANSITDEPELEFLDALPTVWDDTRAVQGSIGEFAVLARRSGDAWFLGAMNAGSGRTLSVPLDFLTPEKLYRATRYSYDATLTNRTKVRIEESLVQATNVLALPLTAANGEAWQFAPVAPPFFTGITLHPNGVVSLTATGYVNAPYSLWRSSNLNFFLPSGVLITNGLWLSNSMSFEEATATNAAASFYRLSVP